MSGSNSVNNSWTVLAPEETVAETLKPLAEETENHEESLTSAAEPESGANQAANGEATAEGSPVEEHLVSEERTVELIGDTSTEQHTTVPPALSDADVPAPLEDPGNSGSDALNRSQDPPEVPAPSSPDPDSFCDSYTHITPSPDEPPASLLTTETLGRGEFTKEEEERLAEEGTVHHINGEEIQQDDESDLSPRKSDLGKQADSPVVGEERTERTEEEAEPEVRRRRRSLLAALDQIGRTEEEEEREEELQVPKRDDDSGFSVNKCILAAVILLGLGTIFFSEGDYWTRELKDSEAPGKQEWLNPEVPPPPVDADSAELLNKLAEENQQISLLQAQFQAQKEELGVAMGQAAEAATERLQWEEVEKENSRLKTEMASLPVLQKENERMKRELKCVLALQQELESLRSTGTELKRSPAATEAAQAPVQPTTSPSSGQSEESTQETTKQREDRKPLKDQKEKKEKYDTGEKKERKEREQFELKEGEKKERKDSGKAEWRKGKREQGKSDKVKDKEGKQERYSDVTKQYKEKNKKREKVSRGDERKSWKVSEGNEEWIEKSERKGRKEVKDWKKAKHEKVNEGKQEKKDRKRGKDHGEKHKWEMKDWKEKGEKKEWKKDGEWRAKNVKEGKRKDERKQWQESENHSRNHGKDRKMKDEKKQRKENESKGKDDKKWKKKDEKKQREKEEEWKRGQQEIDHNYDGEKVRSSSQNNKDEHHHDEHVWGEEKAAHTHRSPTLEQPEYWVQQRDRLRHKTKPPQHCNSLETCAQSEGLLPVPLPEFEAILQTYLAKAEEAGVDASKVEELRQLAPEFFKDGVFAHDQMSFQDFVEDVGDILEDMVEGDENGYETDSEIEEEMEEFEREVIKKFSAPAAAENVEGIQEENGRGRG